MFCIVCEKLKYYYVFISMRKKFLMIVVVLAVARVSIYLGFARGFAKGLRHTNIWWVDQKSIYLDTHEILQKRQPKKHDCLQSRPFSAACKAKCPCLSAR